MREQMQLLEQTRKHILRVLETLPQGGCTEARSAAVLALNCLTLLENDIERSLPYTASIPCKIPKHSKGAKE